MRNAIAIETSYFGPTNYRGARVRVRRLDHRAGDKTVFYAWDYGVGAEQNHESAAKSYAYNHCDGRALETRLLNKDGGFAYVLCEGGE